MTTLNICDCGHHAVVNEDINGQVMECTHCDEVHVERYDVQEDHKNQLIETLILHCFGY